MKLDRRDVAILEALQAEGRISKLALAERVGLSPTPCWNRLKKLEDAGIIEGYGARVDLKRIGPHTVVFVAVELADHTAARFARFEQAVKLLDEITGAWALGGGFDYLLQTVTPDIDAYQRLIDHLLEREIGVARYYSYVVTKPVKGPAAPPIALLLGG
ncbi:Lrp/AsnC family transcriptional regulator [Paralimibaculum aggregatum]|uniref:Lrp/AsnC family transcriptional regulator n=1 Tax=Paralimibaculum aggregatum TaxID=3036245 RepID=A0ABQ6LT61_9RHOB|nr:Lrp/AsnC family transcriptional regulator [Limibaculum sp. NKW23]GMG85251.1 Lrp/AsnC family transcriptional regulator [Limibaculum sp. NKW23]